jgi:hypothetical protein
MQWTSQLPTVSGIYLFMDDLDTIAEEISTFDVDVQVGTVVPTYNLGTPPKPLDRFRGLWLGPIPRG